MKKSLAINLILFLFTCNIIAQKRPIKIVDETINNRIDLYAINENLIDYDIIVTVKGTGFRERGGRQRKVRVPATSKVKVNSLIIERDKTPQYIFHVEASDSLSRRAMRPTPVKIKIDPLKIFILYTFNQCITCDSLVSSLDRSVYNYNKINLSENIEKYKSLEKYIPSLDTITTPILNIGGYILTNLKTVEEVIDKLENE